jgi:hypothetical protein
MTITSLDNFGHASGSISMSELRDYYGQSGAVSLSGDLSGSSNPVPDSLPSSGSALAFSNYRSANLLGRQHSQVASNIMFMCLAGAVLVEVTQRIAVVKRLPLVERQVVQPFVDIQCRITV